jgi:hypothetical protein
VVIVGNRVDEHQGSMDTPGKEGGRLMENKLSLLINLVKHLPEQCLDRAIESLEKVKEERKKKRKRNVLTARIAAGKTRCGTGAGAGGSNIFAASAGRVS